MPTATRDTRESERLRSAVRDFIAQNPTSKVPIRPGHRVAFHWPPHPISYNYHVLASDWRRRATVEIDGEIFELRVAATPHGIFGRCEDLWVEARGDTEEEMIEGIRMAAAPLFARQRAIANCLGIDGRFEGHLNDLDSADLLKLLYCSDRDVASDAQIQIETRPGKPNLLDALIEIIRDDSHPNRRSAQWCVLDLFEDMPAYCLNEDDELRAIAAIRDLIWSANDDYARTIYKAGVCLGGHLPDLHGGPVLMECLNAPSKYGRRAAIHGLFHVVEWHPELRDEVAAALGKASETDPDPLLREYAALMARDIENETLDHISEPIFPEEQ